MNITIEDVSPTRKTLVVTVPAAEIAAEEKTVLGEFTQSVRLPGFRPGKAPADLVRRRYARVLGEAASQPAKADIPASSDLK